MSIAPLGSACHPLRVAIVGSGPSGFYAAEELLQCQHAVEVTMIERLPVPYGLVRSGVAPDHPKLKQPILVYERIARSPGFHYFGNVDIGRDLGVDDLLQTQHAIIFAYGAELDHKLNIPGEDLPGSHSATEFVGWYNGHPHYRERQFDLDQEVAGIIGQGNVALDVARILAKPVDALRHTDIAEHALDALAASKIKEIHLFGRRGPAQAKFTWQELAEFEHIPDCVPLVDRKDLALGDASHIEATDRMNRNVAKNLEILQSFAQTPERGARCRCYFHFFRNPAALLGRTRVEAVRLAKTVLHGDPFRQFAADTDEFVDYPCGLLFRSVGYRGKPMAGLPFDTRRGVLPNQGGRLMQNSGQPLYGLYATGWIKRGANGIIGTNRADSLATVATLLADLPYLIQEKKPGSSGLAEKLRARGIRYVSYQDWRHIDAAEILNGTARGKPREKFTRVDEMLSAVSAGAPGD